MMNLTQFLRAVDQAAAAMSKEQMAEFIHDTARTLPENQREDFLAEMRIFAGGKETDICPEPLKADPEATEHLGRMTGSSARKLLQEALELADDGEQLLANARKYCGEHPELYEQYLTASQGKTDGDSLLAVGTEALEAIEKKYLVRSRIALLTSRTALELDRQKLAETCWLEAFRSDTRVVNYLRLLMECRDFSTVREAVVQIYQKACSQLKKESYFFPIAGDGRENQVDSTQAYMLAFLGGEFDYVREKAMNVKDSLGWSASFMKCGLAAFLLLLTEDGSLPPDALPQNRSLVSEALQKNGSLPPDFAVPKVKPKTMKPGTREMLRKVVAAAGFDKSEYEKGTLKHIEEGNEDWFLTCWLRWKREVLLSREQRDELFGWVEDLVTKRVQGIMEGNHRNYYGECAAYIAALGEARESGGEPGGKQATMAKYMEAYNRRSAFRQEMRGYGMRDAGKKK